MKKLLSIILVALLACSTLASCNAIEKKDDAADNGAANVETVAPESIEGALTYIGLRINPEIEMIADETNTVVSANAINDDGEVLLSTVELEGKTVEDATVEFTEAAIDLGYMDPAKGTDTVYVDVNSESEAVAEKVEKSLSDKLTKYFTNKGLAGKVSEEVLQTYIDTADEWNVSPGHAKLIVRTLSANPELTYNELLDLTVRDLLELLKADKHEDKISANVKDDYKAEIDAVKESFKELFELREQIDDIEDRLEDAEEADEDDDEDALTAEEIAALEAELAEKKAALKALEDEYKAQIDAIKDEYKELSKNDREECRKEADDRKQAKKDGKDFHDDDDDDDDDDRDDRDDRDEHDDDRDHDEKRPEGERDEHKGDRDDDDDDDDEDEDEDDEDDDDDDHRPSKKPADTKAPADTEAPANTETPVDTEAPADTEAPVQAEVA